MRYHVLFLFILVPLTILCVAGGFPLPAMLLFPAPVAYCWMLGRRDVSVILTISAFVVPTLIDNNWALGAVFVLIALSGMLLAIRMQRNMSLGTSIFAVSVFVFLVVTALTLLTWPAAYTEWQTALDVYKNKIESLPNSESTEIQIALLSWLEPNWLFVSFGMNFALILLVTTASNAALYRKLMFRGLVAPENYQFSRMRVPEQLVWIPIALAGLWFLDSKWPNDVVRLLTWNGAIAMAVVYWINGLSIVVYLIQTFQVKPFLVFVFFMLALTLNFHHVFAVVGFFDTWLDIRMRIRRITKVRSGGD
jgi:hypothetical protein